MISPRSERQRSNAVEVEDEQPSRFTYAESDGYAILSADVTDFGGRNADVHILIAPQEMSGRECRLL